MMAGEKTRSSSKAVPKYDCIISPIRYLIFQAIAPRRILQNPRSDLCGGGLYGEMTRLLLGVELIKKI